MHRYIIKHVYKFFKIGSFDVLFFTFESVIELHEGFPK